MDIQNGRRLLIEASQEIETLRNENERMSYRLKMFDDMMLLIRCSVDQSSMAMQPDLIYKITKHLKETQPGQ